ncbi:hypothetical protein [Roseomonas sp. KE0001]|uniref:hypothetical protein n=1 Tax=unclassified Roseomonas TaxID=2617492 RepID=UPI0018DFA866|nr:hypothetical protein [Roseomonas sp. KE0001]
MSAPPKASRGGPAGMTEEEKQAFIRRRRGRNWAILAVLLGLVALFYFIAMARMSITE